MKKAILIVSLALGGCQSSTRPAAIPAVVAQPQSQDYVWLRRDGQRASSSPVLLAQFNSDKRACIGDATEVTSESESCMNTKGYIYVRSSEAPTIAAQLAAARSGRR